MTTEWPYLIQKIKYRLRGGWQVFFVKTFLFKLILSFFPLPSYCLNCLSEQLRRTLIGSVKKLVSGCNFRPVSQLFPVKNISTLLVVKMRWQKPTLNQLSELLFIHVQESP